MSHIKKILVILSIIIASGIVGLSLAGPVSAAPDESIMKKVYAAALYRCYNGSIKPSITNNNQDLWGRQENNNTGETIFTSSASSQLALLPNGWTKVPNDSVTCRELFLGRSESDYGFSGIVATYGMPSDNKATLERLGYDQTMTGLISSGRSCFRPKFTIGTIIGVQSGSMGKAEQQGGVMDQSDFDGPELCFDTSAGNIIASTGSVQSSGSNSRYLNIAVEGEYVVFDGTGVLSIYGNSAGLTVPDEVEYEIGKTTIDEVKNAISSYLSRVPQRNVTEWVDATPDPASGRVRKTRQVIVFNGNIEDTTSSSSQEKPNTGTYQFCNNNLLCAANRADINIFGSSDRALTDNQVTTLYLDYINRYTTYTCNENDQGIKKIRLKVGGEWKDCNIMHTSRETFNGVDSARIFGVPVTLDDIAKYLGTVDEKKVETEGLGENNIGQNPTPPSEDNSGTSNDSSEIDCYGARGTLGASWLICPFLTWTTNGLNWSYDSVVEDYVKTDISITSNDRVYSAWTVFQNAANIVIVIVIMVVIFSQLTGVGIDNYGIKKVLPRLIVCAILINLSYFIMQALVDVSNIVGKSIGGLFQVSGTGGSVEAATSLDVPSNILGISIATAAGAGIAAVVANPAVLLTLILVLIAGLISVLTMWVILSLRQALVLIVIVISPIAVASYILPNTRSFGKKWGSLVKDLLILYPEATFLIGVCFFASGLMADANEAMTFPAIIMRVLPFIALPELFRRSINAIDGLGNRISNYGKSLSHGVTGATRGTDWYKNAQERSLERRTRLRAGINQDGSEATGWRGLLRSRNDRNRARYRQQYLKTQSEQDKANLLNSPEYLEAMRQKQELDRRAEQNEIDLMNTEDYRGAVRAKQDTDLEKKQTEAQASALLTGAFRRSDGKAVNSSNIDSLRDALISEASRDNDKQDISKIRALYDSLLAKGDDGIDALGKVWDSGSLKGKGLQRIMENIASDGNIKAKARSLHATANDVLSGAKSYDTGGGQVDSARAIGEYASKIKPEMISNMTDNERNSYIQYANTTLTTSSTPAEREAVSNAMRNVYLASQNINSFKPGEQADVYNVADRYVQDHMELAKDGTYTYTDQATGASRTANLRRNADNVLVMDVTDNNGNTVSTPVKADFFKNANFRLKRN